MVLGWVQNRHLSDSLDIYGDWSECVAHVDVKVYLLWICWSENCACSKYWWIADTHYQRLGGLIPWGWSIVKQHMIIKRPGARSFDKTMATANLTGDDDVDED